MTAIQTAPADSTAHLGADSPHDQAGGDLLGLAAAGERGEPDLGDLGVTDQFAGSGSTNASG